jgi:tetratricopeptide (TPR) repeat protein
MSVGLSRWILYGGALVVAGTLTTFGIVRPRRAEADADTLLSCADILARIGRFEAAIDDCEKALGQDPANRNGHIILAYASERTRDFPRAAREYEAALRLNRDPEMERLLRADRARVKDALARPPMGEKAPRSKPERKPR